MPTAAPRVSPLAPPPGMVVPPPGMVVAPYAQQPQQAPPPDVRRDPFAAQPTARPGYGAIVDAGPPLEIPQEKKSYTKLIIMLLITAAVPLGVGWACGRIYGARVLFNKGIDDAKQIQEEVTKIAAANRKIAEVVATSQARNKGIVFDEQMIESIKDVLRSSPQANAEKARKQQDQLFRTNYAMMDDIVINRLFNYYNNSIRLYENLELFVQKTERNKELIKTYQKETEKEKGANYGLVFSEDKGQFYIGSLVEVGQPDCAKEVPAGKECKMEDIKGFMVRTPGGSWSARAGKPAAKGAKITDIVVPITPDETWKQVAVGKRGYIPFHDYKRGYLELLGTCALLARDEKPLLQDLGKALGRPKVFAPL
jgi:hypothetical protein